MILSSHTPSVPRIHMIHMADLSSFDTHVAVAEYPMHDVESEVTVDTELFVRYTSPLPTNFLPGTSITSIDLSPSIKSLTMFYDSIARLKHIKAVKLYRELEITTTTNPIANSNTETEPLKIKPRRSSCLPYQLDLPLIRPAYIINVEPKPTEHLLCCQWARHPITVTGGVENVRILDGGRCLIRGQWVCLICEFESNTELNHV